jgi:hypothetical protein
MLGALIGWLSGEKENTPQNNVLSVAAGNMLANDLHDMATDGTQATDAYTICNSIGGLAPGMIVAAPSSGSLRRDLIGEYVGVESNDPTRVIIQIDGICHSYPESMVKAL